MENMSITFPFFHYSLNANHSGETAEEVLNDECLISSYELWFTDFKLDIY